MNPDEQFNELLLRETDEDTHEALQHLAQLIDGSLDRQNAEGLQRALEIGAVIEQRELSDSQASHLHYCISNAWGNLYQLETAGREGDWGWEQPYLEKQILHLRRALALLPARPPKEFGCPYHTNLANAFNSIGRLVEAIEHWQRVLEFEPAFGMALGNLGIGLYSYANHLYDQGHAAVLFKTAYDCLGKAAECDIQPGAKEGFARKRREIEGFFPSGPDTVSTDLHGFELGSTPVEIGYRKWCLEQRLFLNPLNDLGPYPIAGCDIFSQPPIAVGIDEGPSYPGFFNQMKQEFVSARFLFFEGSHIVGPHYSDAGVHLYNTMDYPCYGLSTEKVRIAFRMAYSLMDKIAFFLNHYLSLGFKPWQVSFRKLWYERGQPKKGLRACFVDRRNLPLRGLFWLSKDLFEDRADFREAMEPDAEELSAIRNHLEHKYLKLHENLWRGPEERHDKLSRGTADMQAHSLYAEAFKKKTLKLLKLARAALIYLSLGIHTEERIRAAERDGNGFIPTMLLGTYEDDWKR